MAKKTAAPTKSAPKPQRIGLALSGGGFRASLYHLGTIRYLEEVGIMPRVEVVSTVSGGSIVGAYYLVQMERKLREKSGRGRLELCDEIIDEFCGKLKMDFRMRALVFYPFYHPIQTVLALLRLRHSGDTMAKEFEKHLFSPDLRVGDLPVHRDKGSAAERSKDDEERTSTTRILINATSLINGRRVVFSRESETGLTSQIARSDPNNVPLARVVGASAAVPGLFKPLRIGNEVLADGGVVDNQGIESLLDYFGITDDGMNELPEAFRQTKAAGKLPTRDSVYLVISDAAGQFAVKENVKTTRAGSASVSMSVLQAANRRKVLKLLLDTAGREKDTQELRTELADIAGFAFTHLAMNLKGAPGIGDERLPSELIGPTAELRTDLDSFSLLERDALIYHAYTLMKRQIEQHCAALAAASPTAAAPESDPEESNATTSPQRKHFSWPPSLVEMCRPSSDHPGRALRARSALQRFLRAGAAPLFRDEKRFPLVFMPGLVAFLALGRWFAHLLLTREINAETGTVSDWFARRIGDAVGAAIPNVNVPGVIDLASLQQKFLDPAASNGFGGSIDFLATVICVALSFYVALWMYWKIKRRLGLGIWVEERLIKKLLTTPGGDAQTSPPSDDSGREA